MTGDSRSLDDLEPHVAQMARAMITAAAAEGIKLLVTFTSRSDAEQDYLYSLGRTRLIGRDGTRYKKGQTVTNAKAGDSWHNWRRAFDVVPLKDNGTADWDNSSPAAIKRWHRIGEIGKSVGLEWGGDWKRPDMPHFQFRDGMTLADMKKAAAA